MHERSLARAVLLQVDHWAQQQSAARLTGFKLLVGEFAGVDAQLLELALRELLAEKGQSQVDVVIEHVPLRAACRACDQKFPIVGFVFECPHCRQRDVVIEQGEDLLLASVTFERPLE